MEISASTVALETPAPQFSQPAQPFHGGELAQDFSDVMAEASEDTDSSTDEEVAIVIAPAPMPPPTPIAPIEFDWGIVNWKPQAHSRVAYGMSLAPEAASEPVAAMPANGDLTLLAEVDGNLVNEDAPSTDPPAHTFLAGESAEASPLSLPSPADQPDIEIPKLELQPPSPPQAAEGELAPPLRTPPPVERSSDQKRPDELAFEVRMSLSGSGHETGNHNAYPSWPEAQARPTTAIRDNAPIHSHSFTAVENTRWETPSSQSTEPLRRLYVNVDGDDGQVRLRITERAGELRASVFGNNAEVLERVQAGLGDLSRTLAESGVDAEVFSRTKELQVSPPAVAPPSSAPNLQVSVTDNEKHFDDGSANHGHQQGHEHGHNREQQRHSSEDSKRNDDEPDFNSHMRSYRWLAQ